MPSGHSGLVVLKGTGAWIHMTILVLGGSGDLVSRYEQGGLLLLCEL